MSDDLDLSDVVKKLSEAIEKLPQERREQLEKELEQLCAEAAETLRMVMDLKKGGPA